MTTSDAFHQRRAELAERLGRDEFDLLVVGGGIVGAGVARDAAMRGMRVALVEQYDFASGTSSRTTRLLHGGIRYLAQGRVGLVREASREKLVLSEIAPHLTQPLRFVFPAYRGRGWPLWQLRLGVAVYDRLCGAENLGPSSWMNETEVRAQLPQLDERSLTGAVRFYDALTSDTRLVIDTLRSAERHGALVANQVRLESSAPGGVGWQARVTDTVLKRSAVVSARAVVNATGVWSEGIRHSSIRLRTTKGVHLVVRRERFPCDDAIVLAEGARVLFVIPWGERTILGTTDTDYRGLPERVQTAPEDVRYVLGAINAAFPGVRLAEADVLRTWAGLRPLVDRGWGGPSDISRRHEIHMPLAGWFDIAGGKLTTYRWIAQQTVDRVGAYFRQVMIPSRTAQEPLLTPEERNGACGVLPPAVEPQWVEHYCQREWAVHLDDVMIRRTMWHTYHDDPLYTAEQIAPWMAEHLGWDDARREAELQRYRAVLD